MKRLARPLLVLLLAAVAGCRQESPYSVQVLPACVKQNTAEFTFSNQSATNVTYDVLVDGAQVAVVAPGATSDSVAVKALFLHVIAFDAANTGTMGCPLMVVTPDQCTNTNYVCRA